MRIFFPWKKLPGKAVFSLMLLNGISLWAIQPYIGLHGGVNFSQPIVLSNQQIITMLDGEELEGRIYDPLFQNFGHQIGISIFLGLNDHLSIGILPEIAGYSYGYNHSIEFTDNQGNIALTSQTTSNQKLSYVNFPVIFKYQIRKGKISPYLFAGGAYGFLRNAQHSVNTVSTQDAGNNIVFEENTTDNYTSEFIRSKFNILGGAGMLFDFTQFRLAIDAAYWMGLHNLIDESNRYGNQTVSGTTYDVPDDIILNHLVLNLSVLFPINKVDDRGAAECTKFKSRKR